MPMKTYAFTFMYIVCAFLTNPSYAFDLTVSDTTESDSVHKIVPDFTNVNVIMETEWGTSDRFENVDVIVKMEGNKPFEIVVIKEPNQECSVVLIKGVVVKIIDTKTGNVLKKYQKN